MGKYAPVRIGGDKWYGHMIGVSKEEKKRHSPDDNEPHFGENV